MAIVQIASVNAQYLQGKTPQQVADMATKLNNKTDQQVADMSTKLSGLSLSQVQDSVKPDVGLYSLTHTGVYGTDYTLTIPLGAAFGFVKGWICKSETGVQEGYTVTFLAHTTKDHAFAIPSQRGVTAGTNGSTFYIGTAGQIFHGAWIVGNDLLVEFRCNQAYTSQPIYVKWEAYKV